MGEKQELQYQHARPIHYFQCPRLAVFPAIQAVRHAESKNDEIVFEMTVLSKRQGRYRDAYKICRWRSLRELRESEGEVIGKGAGGQFVLHECESSRTR